MRCGLEPPSPQPASENSIRSTTEVLLFFCSIATESMFPLLKRFKKALYNSEVHVAR